MKRLFLSAALIPLFLPAQVFNYADYWKNRKPDAAYWQQDVHYTIEARVDDTKNEVSGSEVLVYYNNSPDTLRAVYFHLYQNAFQPGSYAHALEQANHVHAEFGKYEAQKMGTVLGEFKVNGEAIPYTIDNTILIAKLRKPLLPGANLSFEIKFRTYWDEGSMRRRFKTFVSGNRTVGDKTEQTRHYDGVHWYPRICVYDRKFGWETDQHLGREFYGDYGVYDVRITIPAKYVMEATGVLKNEKEVMPEDLRKKLDIANYSKDSSGKDGKTYRVPTNYRFNTPSEGTKTWMYHAENVHDFAFTADPSYRIGEVDWNGIRCIALAQERNAAYWYPTAQFVSNVVQIYSRDFGMYGYPKIVAADAADGMEYPMITLDGGNWPGHQSVIAHEVGHNWFYGMVGNNETYRAMLDEGFTQFLTSWSIKRTSRGPLYNNPYDDNRIFNPYLEDALNKNDMPLNTHSDDFNSALGQGGGYRHVYFKTATMLYNLQYVLGDKLFLEAMKHYFDKWKFAHPYPEDFRKAIIEYTHTDLNWFFDEWMETTKSIDYKIVRYKRVNQDKRKDGKYYYEIRLKRKGSMQMPLDITVKDKTGKAYNYLVPNTYFAKNEGQTVLRTWRGWGLLNQRYKDTIALDHKLRSAEIDTTHRLADVYRMDNVIRGCNHKLPTRVRLDKGVAVPLDFNHQYVTLRPDVWFNAVDGIKVGFNMHAEYARVRPSIDLAIWYNTGIGAEKQYPDSVRDLISVMWDFRYLVGKNAYLNGDLRVLDGILYEDFGFSKTFGRNYVNIHHKLIALGKNKSVYWPYANNPSREGKINSSLIVDLARRYQYMNGEGAVFTTLRGTTFGKDYSYGSFEIGNINEHHFHKLDIRTRLFAQVIDGSAIPDESMLNLAGANMEQLLESKFTRSRGWIPGEWLGFGNSTNHFQVGGGLNLRGYAGYAAPITKDNVMYQLYQGNVGASGSIEVDFDRLVNFRPKYLRNFLKLDVYLFADAGILCNSNIANTIVSPLRADAGAGAVLTIRRWGNRNLIQPFSLRLDAPFVLNTPPFADKGYIQQRWVIGLGRSF